MKGFLKYAGVVLAVLLVVPAVYVGYLYFTYIDRTVSSGSAYGFTIGQSKQETYQAARRQFEAGKIVAIDTVLDREDELRSHPWLETDLEVDDVADRLQRWDHWSLSLHAPGSGPTLLAVVVFEGDEVSAIGQPGNLDTHWHPAELSALEIHRGQSRIQVADTLQAIRRAPGYETFRLSTGWMARRQPKTFAPSEFEFVENEDDWALLVDKQWSYFNTVRLRFHEGALAEIHRHRQYFELP